MEAKCLIPMRIYPRYVGELTDSGL